MGMTTTEGIVTDTVALAVCDGTRMLAHVARPATAVAGAPGILVFQEAFGVNDWLRSVVRRLAALGFTAIAPELYHRSGDGVVGSYDAGHDSIATYGKALTVDGLVADITAAYGWLRGDAGVDEARIAAVGFCMGGRTAFLANAHVPLRATVSFYGGNMPRWFDVLDRQHGPLLCFWGDRDETIPIAQRREVADAFANAGLRHTQMSFSSAGHGFFRDVRDDVYDPFAARLAWTTMLEFLQIERVLG
jgi:carboxymethylenebutenolidase